MMDLLLLALIWSHAQLLTALPELNITLLNIGFQDMEVAATSILKWVTTLLLLAAAWLRYKTEKNKSKNG